MNRNRGFITLMSWAALTLLPAAASAQAQDAVPLTIGQTVRITVGDGKTVRGKVLRVTPDSIAIQPGDDADSRSTTTSFALRDILRVQKSDSLKDGAGKGALALGLLGGLFGAAVDGLDSAFGGSSNGSYMLAGIGIGAVSGAAIGAGLDALRLTTIYKRPEGGTSIGVRPIVSATGKGLGVQVRW